MFGSNRQPPKENTQIMYTEYTPDLEASKGGVNKQIKEQQLASEFIYKKQLNYDVEKCNGNIICDEMSIYMDGYEKYEIIENYVSFMHIVSYLATPIFERTLLSLPYTIYDVVKTVSDSNRQSSPLLE